MITDTFIAELREAFRVFGIDAVVSRESEEMVQAGECNVCIDRVFSQSFMISCPDDGFADTDISLPRTAIMAVVEWHLNNPRQAELPFDRE